MKIPAAKFLRSVLTMFMVIMPFFLHAQAINYKVINGEWEAGFNRVYDKRVTIPGLVTDPGKVTPDTLWLRKKVILPAGNWTSVSIELKGARFCPTVYINQQFDFKASGGMAPISHLLSNANLKPGKEVTIEIALLPLNKVNADDASKIPAADLWRSNVSSCIWDDIILRFHQDTYIKSFLSYGDIKKDEVVVKYELDKFKGVNKKAIVQISSISGKSILEKVFIINAANGELHLPLLGKIKKWSPDSPQLYKVKFILKDGSALLDHREKHFGYKEFKVNGLQFELNGKPIKLRAATVVWHRWVRDPEARELAWNEKWFEDNIVKRLKEMGANTIRFHLGMPPEKILDLCDKYGLMVQAEWSFFHGMKASPQSLTEQWNDWFNYTLSHPSTVILHAWNETDNEQELKTAFAAINEVAKQYPPTVIGHRDVIHVHKYWWSLFENLGLYYDSYTQFTKPLMVDEFGGNYLDGNGDIGKYPTNAASFARFLGAQSTAQERLYHQAISNAKVAEYWRRIGVAGFSPFCALSSPEDGNNWFMGALVNGNPKPVWKTLAAAYAPISLSMDIWNKHFYPGEQIEVPVYYFNDTDKPQTLQSVIKLRSHQSGKIAFEKKVITRVAAFTTVKQITKVVFPKSIGEWNLSAQLISPKKTKYPVVSEWVVKTLDSVVPLALRDKVIGIDASEVELKQMLYLYHIKTVNYEDASANLIVLSNKIWAKNNSDTVFKARLEKSIENGKGVLILDAGPKLLGQGYNSNNTSFLQSAPVVTNGKIIKMSLPFGITANFKEVAEPESHIQYAKGDSTLWKNLAKSDTWLWNGYRGELIVPAADMELSGLNEAAYIKSWESKGANAALIKSSNYYAYELEGFYAYSSKPNDAGTQQKLHEKVRFLVDDAPALKNSINPDAPIKMFDLNTGYKKSSDSKVEQLVPMVSAGKDLVRSPVVLLSFKNMKGKLMISQLLTEGRLSSSSQQIGNYGICYDPVSVQFVLNMMEKLIAN
jgi:beta-galactosidase